MDHNYVILMDVSGDLDPSVVAQGEVEFIPMEYSLGSEMRVCSKPESRETLTLFYNGQRNGDFTKTSQISPYMYESYLKPFLEAGKSVLYLCLSSGLSSTYQSALMAKNTLKEEYPDVDFYPVDTLAATGGMGVLAERAIRNRKNGMSIEENAADITSATKHIHLWFMVQDLMYLKRGGRVSAASAMIGTALNITPILYVTKEGKLDTIAKKRGSKAAVKYLISKFTETYDASSDDVIYVIDADIPSLGDTIEAEVRKLYPNATIRRSGLSPIIGAHTGPNMAALIHL